MLNDRIETAMAVIHNTYRFNCEGFVSAVLPPLEQSHGQPDAAHSLLRAAGMQVVKNDKWVQKLLDSYGGWDDSSIDRELPQRWAGDPADISFWLSVILYQHLQVLSPASHGLHNLWRAVEDTLVCGGWDDVDRNLLVRGRNFGVFFDRYVKNNLQYEVANSELRSFFELIQPASISGVAGWLDVSEVALLQRRVITEKRHLEQIAKDSEAREAIERAFDMLSIAAEQETAICLIVSG